MAIAIVVDEYIGEFESKIEFLAALVKVGEDAWDREVELEELRRGWQDNKIDVVVGLNSLEMEGE